MQTYTSGYKQTRITNPIFKISTPFLANPGRFDLVHSPLKLLKLMLLVLHETFLLSLDHLMLIKPNVDVPTIEVNHVTTRLIRSQNLNFIYKTLEIQEIGEITVTEKQSYIYWQKVGRNENNKYIKQRTHITKITRIQ